MKKPLGAIFDLDGTLYRLRGGGSFGNSDFHAALKGRMYSYLGSVLGIRNKEARDEYERIKLKFNDKVSVGVEAELGIDRYEWFANTWNLDPAAFIAKPERALDEVLLPFQDRSLVLTAGPAVWAYQALEYLGLTGIFGDNVITGEPDLRKPNPAIFRKAASILQRQCYEIVSVGDQNSSDILPAKALGMTTVKVGVEIEDADYLVANIYGACELLESLSI